MSVRTSSAPCGNSQENSGVLFTYHFVWSGCVVDVIPSAFPVTTGVSACGGDGASPALVSVKTATRRPFRMFAPVPSFAKTEPEEKLTFTCPIFRARKVSVRIFPEAPIYPGLSTMPSKLTVPALLENDGSAGHREKIDPCLEMDTTSSLSHGKDTTPEAAFIAWSTLSTVTFTEQELPTP